MPIKLGERKLASDKVTVKYQEYADVVVDFSLLHSIARVAAFGKNWINFSLRCFPHLCTFFVFVRSAIA